MLVLFFCREKGLVQCLRLFVLQILKNPFFIVNLFPCCRMPMLSVVRVDEN